jgi:hypothetical protein
MAGSKIHDEKTRRLTNMGKGRPKGAVNKATKHFRDTVNALLEANSENVAQWLETVAYGDGDQVKPDPKAALDLLAKLAEYAAPKLSRTVVAGDPDAPVKTVIAWEQ